MKKYIPVLRKCSLFDGISEDDLLIMLSCFGATVVSFDRKYTILAQGHPAKYIGIMLSGSAQIIWVDYYGNRSILSEIEPTEVFGESFACSEISSLPVSVTAGEPCEVMFIDCRHIMHTCSSNCGFHGQLIYNLMKGLAKKNIMFHQKLEITSRRTTRDKLMAYLAIQARRAGSSSFGIPFDRQELADYLEVDRSGLSAEISKLRAEGVIKSTKKHFELL